MTGGRSAAVSFPCEGLTLEGVLHLPAPGAVEGPAAGLVVCHPHPLYGGDMENGVVLALCRAAVASGAAALRFNFRGVGGSQGAFADGLGERADARAALAYLRGRSEVDAERTALAGYSFGAAVALLAADESARALITVSVPTIARGLDEIAVSCPVLLVVGEEDQVAPPSRLASLAGLLGPHARLLVVPGADHFWWGAEERLSEIASAFLRRVLTAGGKDG